MIHISTKWQTEKELDYIFKKTDKNSIFEDIFLLIKLTTGKNRHFEIGLTHLHRHVVVSKYVESQKGVDDYL